jgi:hypothetical protein
LKSACHFVDVNLIVNSSTISEVQREPQIGARQGAQPAAMSICELSKVKRITLNGVKGAFAAVDLKARSLPKKIKSLKNSLHFLFDRV